MATYRVEPGQSRVVSFRVKEAEYPKIEQFARQHGHGSAAEYAKELLLQAYRGSRQGTNTPKESK